jgi:hypothetical protein
MDTMTRQRAAETNFGLVLVAHGLAHALAGTQVLASPRLQWVGWLAWCVAMTGFVAAGFGMLSVRPLTRHVGRITLLAVTASVILMLLYWRLLWSVPALVIDFAILAAIQRRPMHAAPAVGTQNRLLRTMSQVCAVLFLSWLLLVALSAPWRNRWGSTDAELLAQLPGDAVDAAHSTYSVQHAITIRAPAEAVWPWLAQLGTDRGGFYSHAWLERLFGISVTNAERIHPEWQDVRTGGFVLAAPAGYLGFDEPLGWRVQLADAPRALVLENWGTFAIVAQGDGTSRLIIRSRNAHAPTLAGIGLTWVGLMLFEPAHFIMQRSMMRGIKERAERTLMQESV